MKDKNVKENVIPNINSALQKIRRSRQKNDLDALDKYKWQWLHQVLKKIV